LKTYIHLSPYALKWLSENDDLVVDRPVNISLSIEKYVNEIVCDVVPMETSHLLVERP